MRRSLQLICGYLTTILSATAAIAIPAHAHAADYCLALRGNGEAQPAHWGALASVVEKMGLPRIQAGGSSATISMFLLDSMASNPWVADATLEQQARRASLMLKSLTGTASYLAQTPTAKAALDFYASYQAANKLGGKARLLKQMALNPMEMSGGATGLAKALYDAGLGQTPRYRELIKSLHTLATRPTKLSMAEIQRVRFYSAELYQALTTIGAFDAESDSTLLFRDGIVDFRALATSIGKIATFYAETDFEAWGAKCEREHEGKTWQETIAKIPQCQTELHAMLVKFFSTSQEEPNAKRNVVTRLAGQSIASLPTTAVLTGHAYEKAKSIYERYHATMDRMVALEFKVDDIEEVRFGYWGLNQLLKKAERNLRRDYAGDFKSSRFLPLGEATWQEVLSLSPAEPGLASVQKMMANGKPAFSVGGWSDLHPVPVLKAAGCETVIYVTRRGGESLFGQGIAKRVFGFERSWDVLRTKTAESVSANGLLNDLGDLDDLSSVWAKLYNVANAQSSYMLSVAKADAVLCTDWNRYDVKSQMDLLVNESYRAPFLAPAAALADQLKAKGATFVADPFAIEKGRPLWIGCRATR
jgi:hypothetical protein